MVATQVMAVPVVAVEGAVSETERSAGEEDRSFTGGKTGRSEYLVGRTEGTQCCGMSAMPFCPQRTIFRKLVG